MGQALAQAGALAGFECLVADDRPEFRRPGAFPPGVRLAEVGRDYQEPSSTPVRNRDLYVAVVSRCWETDTAALAGSCDRTPPGSATWGSWGAGARSRGCARRSPNLRLRLRRPGLRAPIGLPIGGDSPGEIAISILAEVIRTRYGRTEAI